MKSAKGGLLRVFFWEGAILVALVSAVAVGYVARKPVLISYHRLADRSAFSGMRRYATAEGPRSRFERCAKRHHDHFEALVRLGYYERRTFHTKYMTRDSPQMENLLAEFRRRQPGSSYSMGGGRELRRRIVAFTLSTVRYGCRRGKRWSRNMMSR
jgi:hypothetical protein